MAKIYKEEEVESGSKAKWPYDADYSEPFKKGYLFEGWEYDGNVYEPPFDDEASNPFGPITKSVDINTVWDKLAVFADANHTLISGDGDTDADPTKMMYWAQTAKGKMITDGVELKEVALDVDMLPIQFSGSGSTAVVDDKNVRTRKVKENDVNKSRYYRFRAAMPAHSLESETIEIEQVGKDQTILPDFDFFTFTYDWADTDGRDLDTATFVVGTNIPIGSDGKTLANYPVGFGCKGSTQIDPDYNHGSSNNPELFAEVSQYIKGGGDNLQSGKESALINWKEICNRDFITEGITKLYCELYANWYAIRHNGNCKVSFKTYKTESGTGSMQLDRDSKGKTLFTFSPTGDTQLKTETNISGNVYASSSLNESSRYSSPTGDESGYYTHVATLIYDVKTKNGVLYNKMNVLNGRNVRFDSTFNDVNKNDDGLSEYSHSFYYEHGDTGTKTFTFGKQTLYIKGVANELYVDMTDDDIKDAMDWYGGEGGWVDFVSSTRDSEGHLQSVTFKLNQENTTAKQREMDVPFRMNLVDNIRCIVRLRIYQKVNS